MQDFPLGSRPPFVSGSGAEMTALSEIRKYSVFSFFAILADNTDAEMALKCSQKTDRKNGGSLF